MAATTSADTFDEPLLSNLDRGTTKLIVGPDSVEYTVHTGLLTASSANFAAALRNRCVESHHNRILLRDTSVEAFNIYYDWIYRRSRLEIRNADGWYAYFRLAVQTYIFADRYDIPQLRRAILTHLIRTSAESGYALPYKIITAAHENLPAKDPLLAWLVDDWASNWDGQLDDPKDLEDLHEKVPPPFMARVVLAMARIIGSEGAKRPIQEHDPCDYHQHATNEDRRACRYKDKEKTKKRKRY